MTRDCNKCAYQTNGECSSFVCKYRPIKKNYIRDVLDASDMMHREIGIRTGITEASISRYYNGNREAKISSFAKICDACGYELIVRRKGDKDGETRIDG